MISGFDFDTPLPIAATVAGQLRAQSDRRGARCPQFQVRGGVLYPGHRRPEGRVGAASTANFMPRAGFSWQPQPKTVGSRRLRPVLRRARHQPHQRQPDRLFARHGADAVARQRADVHRDAHQPVSERAARAGRQRSRPDDERRPGRRPSPTTATSEPRATHRWSIGLQRELPGQFLVEGTYVGSHCENLPVTQQLNAVPGQYFSTSPVRDDATNNCLSQQVPNPFAGLLPGTNINGANVAGRSCSGRIRSSPAITATRDHRHVRLQRASRAASSAGWRTASPCRSPTPGRRR